MQLLLGLYVRLCACVCVCVFKVWPYVRIGWAGNSKLIHLCRVMVKRRDWFILLSTPRPPLLRYIYIHVYRSTYANCMLRGCLQKYKRTFHGNLFYRLETIERNGDAQTGRIYNWENTFIVHMAYDWYRFGSTFRPTIFTSTLNNLFRESDRRKLKSSSSRIFIRFRLIALSLCLWRRHFRSIPLTFDGIYIAHMIHDDRIEM